MITGEEFIKQCFGGIYFTPPSLPSVTPGLTGKLISKCRRYRKSWMLATKQPIMIYSPTAYKLGEQIYMLMWNGPSPDRDNALAFNQEFAFFVRRKEVPIEDERVQTALAATIAFVRMRGQQMVSEWGSWGSQSAAPTWGTGNYTLTTSSTVTLGTSYVSPSNSFTWGNNTTFP